MTGAGVLRDNISIGVQTQNHKVEGPACFGRVPVCCTATLKDAPTPIVTGTCAEHIFILISTAQGNQEEKEALLALMRKWGAVLQSQDRLKQDRPPTIITAVTRKSYISDHQPPPASCTCVTCGLCVKLIRLFANGCC